MIRGIARKEGAEVFTGRVKNIGKPATVRRGGR